jgi:hypothetical protein
MGPAVAVARPTVLAWWLEVNVNTTKAPWVPLMGATMLAATLGMPTTASAVGVGTSVPVSNGLGDLAALIDSFEGGGGVRLGYTLPSLDLRFDEFVVQIHALETVVTLANDEVLYLGANAWTPVTSGTLGGQWEAFAGVGGSLDFAIDGGDALVQAGPVAPVGVRFGTVPRVAIYVQPGLYVASIYGDLDVVADAQLLTSVWF